MIKDKSISNYHRYLTRVYFNTRKKHTFCSMTLKQMQNKIYTFTETKNFSKKISFNKWGRAFGPQAQALGPHFLKGFFWKSFLFLWKYKFCFEFVSMSCCKMCIFFLYWNILVSNICGSSKSIYPWSFNLWLKSNHLNIMCKSSNPLAYVWTAVKSK